MTFENAEKAKGLLETLDRLNSDLEEINELKETWQHCGKKILLEITSVDDCCDHWVMTEHQGKVVFAALLNIVETQINDIKAKIESL